MQNLHHDLEEALKDDQSLLSDGKILKNAVIERAAKMDAGFLNLLLQSEPIRRHFFEQIEGTLVFDKAKFQDFVSNKEFLPDSYTSFKNRIGLMDGKRYLKESRDVVLAWPYKDCVLEGGQTKEDRGRTEVFWNTTLAPDDITRLFEPKALTGFQLWDADAVRDENPKSVKGFSGDENLLVKGNNLLVLHSMKSVYAGRVKMIYIDPPYNTGGDSFKYNDSFSHSTWLTFIKNRLEVAKEFLRDDGLIFVQVDDIEHAYLKVLMDEVFGRDNFIACVAYERSGVSGIGQGSSYLVNTHEFILSYAKNKSASRMNPVYVSEEIDYEVLKRYNKILANEGEKQFVTSFVAPSTGEEVNIYKHTGERIETVSMRNYDERKSEIIAQVRDNFNYVFRTTSVQEENEFQNRILGMCGEGLYSAEYTVSRGKRKGERITAYYLNNQVFAWLKDTAEVTRDGVNKQNKISQFWSHGSIPKADLSNEGGVALRRGKKPENLLKRLVSLSTEEGDLVMDFFAGSGTTAAVAHKMKRQWLAVEQMNYVEDLTAKRLKSVVAGDRSGISSSVGWSGGGSFVYAELAKWNHNFFEKIERANSRECLKEIELKIRKYGYVKPGVDFDNLDQEEFLELPFDEQKKILLEFLNLNHLYVNCSDMDDVSYSLTDSDKDITRKFYEVGYE